MFNIQTPVLTQDWTTAINSFTKVEFSQQAQRLFGFESKCCRITITSTPRDHRMVLAMEISVSYIMKQTLYTPPSYMMLKDSDRYWGMKLEVAIFSSTKESHISSITLSQTSGLRSYILAMFDFIRSRLRI